MASDPEYQNDFQAEFEFVVYDGKITSAAIIFNETFANERRVDLHCKSSVDVRSLREGSWLDPSFLEFRDSGEVEFCLLFSSWRSPGNVHRTDFVELLWELSRLGFRAVENSSQPIFSYAVGSIMNELAVLESTAEIEVLKYYGILFHE